MPNTNDLIGLAIDKNPVDFADTFNQIIMQKAAEALENRKLEMANSVYGASDQTTDEEDFEDFDPAVDADGSEIEDLDLDDIDIDELEDISDDQEDDQ